MSECYFLGAMTAGGFSTEFGKILNDRKIFTYILKGGAGTGKSSLMKKIAQHFEPICHVERYYCSSDPNSLDAVVMSELGTAIVDGTSPHVFDPIVPGVSQKIVNLGEYWDSEALQAEADRITAVILANKSMLARAQRFTNAVSSIRSDTYQIGSDCLMYEKLDLFADRFKKKILGKKGNGRGTKSIRQLTALTENGIMTLTQTLGDYFDVYLLNDLCFSATNYFITLLSDEATARGYDVIVCPSHLSGNTAYEHLLIPETGIAIVSETALNGEPEADSQRINLNRFYDKQALDGRKARLKMNRSSAKELTDEAVRTIKTAKKIHDEIESYYISAMNFERVNEASDKIISEIEAKNIRG